MNGIVALHLFADGTKPAWQDFDLVIINAIMTRDFVFENDLYRTVYNSIFDNYPDKDLIRKGSQFQHTTVF